MSVLAHGEIALASIGDPVAESEPVLAADHDVSLNASGAEYVLFKVVLGRRPRADHDLRIVQANRAGCIALRDVRRVGDLVGPTVIVECGNRDAARSDEASQRAIA